MKLKDATTAKRFRPLVHTEKLSITVEYQEGKITILRARREDGKEKEFPVVKYNIIAAWEKMRLFVGVIKFCILLTLTVI